MVDNIILSTDEHFKHFVPVACLAWKKFFPELNIKIAFVTERSEDDVICQRMREYGELHIFKTVADVPTANQAKVARHFLAASLENEVSTIEDVDTAPLQRDFWVDKFKNREEGHMLAVGAELKVYTGINENKFPISTMTAEGAVFKDLFNTQNLSFSEYITSLIGIQKFDHKEDIKSDVFSDESLVRYLRHERDVKFHDMKRDVNIEKDWIDRSWWHVDPDKLTEGGYVCCNFKRPYEHHMTEVKEIVEYISPGSKPIDLLL
jgi:hypothetical protein